jgi:chromosome segregation ATPase
MISALKQERQNEFPQELEIVNAVHKKELAEIKEKHQEALNVLKARIKELQVENEKIKASGNQLATKNELAEREWKVKYEEVKSKYKDAEWKLKKAEDDKHKSKEVEKLKNECKKKLTEMKDKYKQEQNKLEEKVRILEVTNIQYTEQINELILQLENYKEVDKELKGMQTQRDSALEQIQTFRGKINQTRKLKSELLKAKDLLEASEEKMEELKKARIQVLELKGHIHKLQKSTVQLKSTITELEQEKSAIQKNFMQEKEKLEIGFNRERVQLMKLLEARTSNKDETMNAPRIFTSTNDVRVEYKGLKE